MKEKTKEMADQVGAVYPMIFLGRQDGVLFTETELETFVELIRAAEREDCAELCDDLDDDLVDGLAGWQYGEAIRARGTP